MRYRNLETKISQPEKGDLEGNTMSCDKVDKKRLNLKIDRKKITRGLNKLIRDKIS